MFCLKRIGGSPGEFRASLTTLMAHSKNTHSALAALVAMIFCIGSGDSYELMYRIHLAGPGHVSGGATEAIRYFPTYRVVNDFPNGVHANVTFRDDWWFTAKVTFNFAESPPIGSGPWSHAKGITFHIGWPNGTVIRRTPSYIHYAGAANETITMLDTLSGFAGWSVADAWNAFNGSEVYFEIHSYSSSLSAADGSFGFNMTEWTTAKYYTIRSDSTYWECKEKCQLAVILSRDELSALGAVVNAEGLISQRGWIGLVNWGVSDASGASELLCWDAMPGFTVDGCRGLDNTATWKDGSWLTSFQMYPPYVGPAGAGNDGRKAFTSYTGNWMATFANTKSKYCYCQRGMSTPDGKYLSENLVCVVVSSFHLWLLLFY